MEEDPDVGLLDGLRAGSNGATAEAVRRHWSSVLKFFINKADAQADDLRQETFSRFLRQARGFEGRSSLRVFILGIARNVLLEYIRGKRRNSCDDLDHLSIVDCDVGVSSLLQRQGDVQHLLRALRRLPINTQILLELHYCERLTDRETSALLDISPHTVRSRLSRARDRLRRELADLAASVGPPDEAGLSRTPTDFHAWEVRIRHEMLTFGQACMLGENEA